jgi:hypothetical protein
MFSDDVKVTDRLSIYIKDAKNKVVNTLHEITSTKDKQSIQGKFTIKAYERGKLRRDLCRNGENIWLIEGRKYDALVKSYKSYGPDTPFRNDRIKYVGLGSGSQPEVPKISKLASPIAFNASNHFLATLEVPTFSTNQTVVTYTRFYDINEISVAAPTEISEIGLFTDGAAPDYIPGTRNISLATAAAQAPLCYKAFEKINKTTDITLLVEYSLYHN